MVLREVPPTAGERRLGRFGRTNKALRRQLGLEEEAGDSKAVDETTKITRPAKTAGLLEKPQ